MDYETATFRRDAAGEAIDSLETALKAIKDCEGFTAPFDVEMLSDLVSALVDYKQDHDNIADGEIARERKAERYGEGYYDPFVRMMPLPDWMK